MLHDIDKIIDGSNAPSASHGLLALRLGFCAEISYKFLGLFRMLSRADVYYVRDSIRSFSLNRCSQMSPEAEVWSENIACGNGDHHEVVFAMTPWNGVEISFNPCDAIPDAVGSLRANRCNSNNLLAERNFVLQTIWFGDADGIQGRVPSKLFNKFSGLFNRRHKLAQHIIAEYQCEKQRFNEPHLIWAEITNCDELTFNTNRRPAIMEFLKSANMMMQLHLIQFQLQQSETRAAWMMDGEDLDWLLNASKNKAMPAFFRSRLATELATQGTKSALAALIELAAIDGFQKVGLAQVRLCLKRLTLRHGDKVAIESLLELLGETSHHSSCSLKLWYSVLGDLPAATVEVLVGFAANHSSAVRETIAFVVCSEQFSQRNRAALLQSLDDYPVMAPYLVECVRSDSF